MPDPLDAVRAEGRRLRECRMNASKAKGTAAETALVRWFIEHGHPHARRNPPAGARDIGDIGGITTAEGETVTVETKSWKDVAAALRQGIAELEVEKANAGTAHGVLVVKRRGVTDPGEWYAVRRVADDPEIGLFAQGDDR